MASYWSKTARFSMLIPSPRFLYSNFLRFSYPESINSSVVAVGLRNVSCQKTKLRLPNRAEGIWTLPGFWHHTLAWQTN